jgi:hypothetical protein
MSANNSKPSYITDEIPDIAKPIILENDGVMAQLRDGAIINAGGVAGSYFTVGGRGLMFDDGTSTGGTGGSSNQGFTLQQVYDFSPKINGKTVLRLTSGKDFKIVDSINTHFFSIDSETGAVNITGDLFVNGNTVKIDTTIQDSDHWVVSPASGSTIALDINPDPGVSMITDLVAVRAFNNQTDPAFRIDEDGDVHVNMNLFAANDIIVDGLVDGVKVSDLAVQVNQHMEHDDGDFKHTAADSSVDPMFGERMFGNSDYEPKIVNVQQALDTLSEEVGAFSSVVKGFRHSQFVDDVEWTINHNAGTRCLSVTIYDSNDVQIIPHQVKIESENTVKVSFLTPISGTAILMYFYVPVY